MTTYSADEIYGFARAAGFSADQATTMTAIALAESGGNVDAHATQGEVIRPRKPPHLQRRHSAVAGFARAPHPQVRHGDHHIDEYH
jgi:hypothetical protein